MAKASKKKPFTKDDLEHHYWHIILTHGKRPVNVYAFVQELEIEETEFYKHVASFEALEARYWERLVEESIAVLGDDDDYADYSSDQKLLAFFYTFFQHAQKHRSRMVEFFPSPGCSKVIKPMRKRFLHYAKEIVDQGLEEGSVADRKNLTDKYQAGVILNHVASQIGGKGGGRSDMAQGGGTEPEKLSDALNSVKDLIR